MFKDLFIIRHTGECIYHQNFDGVELQKQQKPQDAQLFSGFLSAIMTFYEQLHGGSSKAPVSDNEKRQMDYFSLKKFNYFILNGEEEYFCIIHSGVDNKLTNDDINILLEEIAEKFYENINKGIFDNKGIRIIHDEAFEVFVKGLISSLLRKKLFGLSF